MRISNAESLIMDCLWQRSPLAADEIAAEIVERNGWSEATVRTLIHRLMNKKAITATKDGRRYLYRPLVARDDYLDSESQSLLDRLFEGRLAPLVAHLSERERITLADVAEIKALIKKLDEDRKDGE